MASKFCSKCGREVVAGKRFCGGCGQSLPVPAAPLVETAAAAPACGQCGTALVPGKRFCKQCGHAVGEVAVAATATQVAEPCPVAEAVAAELPESVAPVTEPKTVPPAEFASETVPVSKWAPVEETVLPPEAAFAATPAPAPVSGKWPKAKTGLAIGLAAAVLLVAGGGWMWYSHAHRSVSSAAGSAAPAKQSAAPMLAQEQTQATTTQAAKPPAGTSGTAVPEAPQAPSQPASNLNPAPHPQRPNSLGHTNPKVPTPVFQKPPVSPNAPLLAPPAQAHSGVRHYQGPPVAHDGKVVFDNLPKARLKFTFNHAAWQLIIKPNPDGTKKVILTSLSPGYQASCDLGWEIVE